MKTCDIIVETSEHHNEHQSLHLHHFHLVHSSFAPVQHDKENSYLKLKLMSET